MLKLNRAFLGMFLITSPLAAGGACSDSSEEEKAADQIAKECTLNSECKEPLVCAFQRCHSQCDESRDCPNGQRCVKGQDDEAEKPGVCQLPDETECKDDDDCDEQQFCARDGECRDGCSDDDDCVGDQTCTASNACADPSEVKNGDVPPANGEGGAGGTSSSPGGGGEAGGGEPTPPEGGAGGASSGGTSTGGKAGTGGNATGGTSNEGGAPGADNCSVKDIGNDDRDSATPVEFGVAVEACLQSIDDADWYEFTTPEEPLQGGYVTLTLTDVGAKGSYYLAAHSATDNGEIPAGRHYGPMGESGAVWFPAAPGQTFRASVEPYSVIPPEYTFTATFIPYEDTYEPNDTREEAKPVEKDTDISGYLFKGFSSKTAPGNDQDWYQVSLDAGSVTVTFSGGPKLGAYIRMHNDTGAQVSGGQVYVNPGVDGKLEVNNVAIGDYYFVLEHYTGGMTWQNGTTVPADLDPEPYTLRIVQD